MTLADLFTAMANAIRAKGGTSAALYPNQMPQAIADIQPQISLQSKTKSYTPSETAQSETVSADTGYDGLQQVSVSVGAISSSYVGTGVTRRTSSDLGASGATVTAPAGYYENAATKTISSGSATPAASISATGATVSTSTNTLTLSKSSVSNTPQVSAGYISAGTAGNSSVSLSASVNIRSSSDLSASGASVTAPAGYYPSAASKSVSSGTEGTPTATKGTVSNHSISVTPSVTNSAGYITGSTKTGTAVTVAASELVSGSETKTANGTYDVTNLAQLVVNVSGGGGGSGLTLLSTYAFGSFSGSATSATNTNKSMTVTGYNDYDVLIVDVSVNSTTNGRHTSTVSFVMVTGQSNVTTKDTYAVASNKWNSKLSSSGTATTRQSTSAYGIYAYSASVSNSTMTISFYYRYNSNNTGTINGTYTARVYGLKLYDLIGG